MFVAILHRPLVFIFSYSIYIYIIQIQIIATDITVHTTRNYFS